MIDPDIRESMERRAREEIDRLRAKEAAKSRASAEEVMRIVNDTRPPVAAASSLVTLAGLYRQAAGEAFAAGNDADAAKLREVAAKLDALAAELPPLPKTTR